MTDTVRLFGSFLVECNSCLISHLELQRRSSLFIVCKKSMRAIDSGVLYRARVFRLIFFFSVHVARGEKHIPLDFASINRAILEVFNDR